MFGRKRLQRENEALRNALGWYADESNWKRRAVNPKDMPRQWVKSHAARDRGARALSILTQLDAPCAVAWKATVPPPLAECEPTTTE